MAFLFFYIPLPGSNNVAIMIKHIVQIVLALVLGAEFASARTGGDQLTVLQWNIWQEGTQVEGGYDAIVNEIVRLRPDFVTLSEVRNYHGVDFISNICKKLEQKGVKYYGFSSYDTGILSSVPYTDSLKVFPEKDDHGSIHGLHCEWKGHRLAIYTAHLDYLNDAYYDVRGYDGSTWQEIPIPESVEEVLRRNALSQRDEAIEAFLAQAAKDEAENRIIILGGDFNEPSHLDWTEKTRYLYDHHGLVIEWPQTKSLEKAGFIDAYRAKWPDPIIYPGFTFPSDNPAVDIKRLTWAPLADERDRIDYLFFKGNGVQIEDCVIFGPQESIAYGRRVPNIGKDRFIKPQGVWPTDHKGVWMSLIL